jgi:hypothetical protein
MHQPWQAEVTSRHLQMSRFNLHGSAVRRPGASPRALSRIAALPGRDLRALDAPSQFATTRRSFDDVGEKEKKTAKPPRTQGRGDKEVLVPSLGGLAVQKNAAQRLECLGLADADVPSVQLSALADVPNDSTTMSTSLALLERSQRARRLVGAQHDVAWGKGGGGSLPPARRYVCAGPVSQNQSSLLGDFASPAGWHTASHPLARSGECGFISATCASLGSNAKCSALAADFLLSGDMSRWEVGVMG